MSFVNGGRRLRSGQSVACLHGPSYVVLEVPPLYKAIRTRRENLWNGDCPICKGMPSADLRIWTDPSGAVDLLADPAPIHNWCMLVLPRRHNNLLASVDAYALRAAIQAAVKAWRGVFSVEAALNVLIRYGEDVGHDHHVAVLFILEAFDQFAARERLILGLAIENLPDTRAIALMKLVEADGLAAGGVLEPDRRRD